MKSKEVSFRRSVIFAVRLTFSGLFQCQTLKVLKHFLYLLLFFLLQMASKLILGCLALMVVSTYARSSKF